MTFRFAARTGWNITPNQYSIAWRSLLADPEPHFNLTASNPTVSGFEYDAAAILAGLSQREVLEYSPDPRGLSVAREAVAQYYLEAAATRVPPDSICLTTSTSEAYSYLFRLHCDPGTEVLIAQPSYPLFEFLADLNDIRLVPYALFYDYGWHIDLAGLAAGITPATRAVIVVNPNNPTGNFVRLRERDALERLCVQHGLALIVDEVFLDYPLQATQQRPEESAGTRS